MRLLAIVTLACLAGCSHPLEIAGEGDIVSASGERDCSLEEYNSGAPTCSENYISGAYDEIYQALPRPGWEFEGWGKLSARKSANTVLRFFSTCKDCARFLG